jgi:hypothetical protein
MVDGRINAADSNHGGAPADVAAYYFELYDSRGLLVSSEHANIPIGNDR